MARAAALRPSRPGRARRFDSDGSRSSPPRRSGAVEVTEPAKASFSRRTSTSSALPVRELTDAQASEAGTGEAMFGLQGSGCSPACVATCTCRGAARDARPRRRYRWGPPRTYSALPSHRCCSRSARTPVSVRRRLGHTDPPSPCVSMRTRWAVPPRSAGAYATSTTATRWSARRPGKLNDIGAIRPVEPNGCSTS